MSDFRTIQEYMQHQEETAIPKLRWLQVKTLRDRLSTQKVTRDLQSLHSHLPCILFLVMLLCRS